MNNFKVKIMINGVDKRLVVRRKKSNIHDNVNTTDDILDDLGLEKVSYKELVQKYQKIKETTEDECSICKANYKKGEYKRKLNCNHEFHKKCIDKWLKNRLDCPLCRTELIN